MAFPSVQSVVFWSFVSRLPNVLQRHSRMEPVENTDGECGVAQYSPGRWAVELNLDSLVVIALDHQGLHNVHC